MRYFCIAEEIGGSAEATRNGIRWMQIDALLNLPAKCDGAFLLSRDEKTENFSGKFPTEFVRSTTKADGERRIPPVHIPHVCVQPHAQLKASVSLLSILVSRCIAVYCAGLRFRLPSSLFRQLAPLSPAVFQFSIAYPQSAVPDFIPFPAFPSDRSFSLTRGISASGWSPD